MRANGSLALPAVALAACAMLAGCAGSAAPSPSLVTAAALASPSPTTAPATPAPATSTPNPATPTSAATPAPTMDPALVGTWTGGVKEPKGIVEFFKATYTLGECAIDEQCGTWSWEGRINQPDPNRAWAVVGDTITCAGPLTYSGFDDGDLAFLQTTTDFKTAPGGTTCGNFIVHLSPVDDGSLHIDVLVGSSRLSYGTLHRAATTPMPTASQ